MPAVPGRYPSGQRGQTVNLLAYAFGGSNPPLPTIVTSGACTDRHAGGLAEKRVAPTCATTDKGVAPTRATTVDAHTNATADVCRNSSVVERQPSKLGVAGSNPVSRSIVASGACSDRTEGGPVGGTRGCVPYAHVAQLAERVLGKDEVSGSNPDMGSRFGRPAVIAAFNGR